MDGNRSHERLSCACWTVDAVLRGNGHCICVTGCKEAKRGAPMPLVQSRPAHQVVLANVDIWSIFGAKSPKERPQNGEGVTLGETSKLATRVLAGSAAELLFGAIISVTATREKRPKSSACKAVAILDHGRRHLPGIFLRKDSAKGPEKWSGSDFGANKNPDHKKKAFLASVSLGNFPGPRRSRRDPKVTEDAKRPERAVMLFRPQSEIGLSLGHGRQKKEEGERW